MKRVVVDGAGSMIGAALIRECIRNDVEVLAIVRKGSSHLDRLPSSDLIEICECDLDQMDSIAADKRAYDVFYHFAWGHTSKQNRDNPILQEQNIRFTLDAVNLAKRLGCKKFIGAGSQAEYGKVDGIIRPDTSVHPQISYGMAKYSAGRLSEKLCGQYGMTHIWARIFSVYGKYDNPGTMLSYAIEQFLKGEAAEFSPATQDWDYLYEDDAGRAFYLLGERAKLSKVYCVASGQTRKLKDFILDLQEEFGPEARCVFAEDADERLLLGIRPDIEALKRDTGFEPEVSFKEGIRKVIEYWKTDLCGSV